MLPPQAWHARHSPVSVGRGVPRRDVGRGVAVVPQHKPLGSKDA